MGRFTIELSSGMQWCVRHGIVTRKTFGIFSFLKRKSPENSAKKGYIVTLEPIGKGSAEYRLLKTLTGQWITTAEAGFQAASQDEISVEIQQAIDKYEKERIEQPRQ